MNDAQKVATLRTALERCRQEDHGYVDDGEGQARCLDRSADWKRSTPGECICGRDEHNAAIDAALAATAEPVKPETACHPDNECWPDCSTPLEPGPAPLAPHPEALLAFGEKVREACAIRNGGETLQKQVFARRIRGIDLAALLPVKP